MVTVLYLLGGCFLGDDVPVTVQDKAREPREPGDSFERRLKSPVQQLVEVQKSWACETLAGIPTSHTSGLGVWKPCFMSGSTSSKQAKGQIKALFGNSIFPRSRNSNSLMFSLFAYLFCVKDRTAIALMCSLCENRLPLHRPSFSLLGCYGLSAVVEIILPYPPTPCNRRPGKIKLLLHYYCR